MKTILFCSLGWLLAGGMLSAGPMVGETAFIPHDGASAKPGLPPLKLTVGVNDVYCKDSSCKCIEQVATRQFGDFCSQLKKRYQIELELVYFLEPYDLDKAFLEGKFDAVLCKPWLIFRNAGGRSSQMARLADLQDLHGDPGLWGTVIVPKDSPIKKLAGISGRRVAYGQSDAYEKHQGALKLFERAGIHVKKDLLVEKASCLECLDLLMKGQVDAAVISNYALTADCAVDVTSPDAWRVLGVTETIPLTSFIVDLKRVSPDEASRIQQAMVGICRDALPASMSGGGFVKPVSWKVPRAMP